jgi:hypothetical protein
MTYQVLEMCLSTTVQTYDATTGKRICDVRSTEIHTNQAQQTWTPMSSSALHAEFKEIVYKSFPKEKELV